MDLDVSVISVENVYSRKECKWKRNVSKARYYDAVVFFTEGEIEYRFSNKTVVAQKGDLLFLPGNLTYSGISRTEYCSYYVIDFLCADERQFERFGAPLAFSVKSYQATLKRFEDALSLWNQHSMHTVIGLKELLYALIKERFFPKSDGENQTNGAMVLQYIDNSAFDVNLTVNKMCKELYISDSQVRRYVHSLTGLSPNKYITMIRLNRAKAMLTSTKASIQDISYACGFKSPYYFSRAFSLSVGMSPSTYRAFTSE